MAQQNAFNAALTRIGFNIDTTERIIDEGFETLETLSELEESDIDNMIKNVRETHRALGAITQQWQDMLLTYCAPTSQKKKQ